MQGEQKLSQKLKIEIDLKCLTCTRNNCENCRHAIKESQKIYCTKTREFLREVINCPEFDPEPLEYKLFKRI